VSRMRFGGPRTTPPPIARAMSWWQLLSYSRFIFGKIIKLFPEVWPIKIFLCTLIFRNKDDMSIRRRHVVVGRPGVLDPKREGDYILCNQPPSKVLGRSKLRMTTLQTPSARSEVELRGMCDLNLRYREIVGAVVESQCLCSSYY
jgi:hypothetical protein